MGLSSRKVREVSPSSYSITMANIRQNYNEECEALINKHVNTKLYHSYVYLYLSAYFNRDDQALPGFAAFFWNASEGEHRNAAALMEYQTMRGGRVVLQNITKPTITEWGSPLEALTAAKGDFHLASFIQEKFLRKQVLDIKMIGDFLTKIKRVGTGLGVHMLDRDLAAFIQTRRANPIVKAYKTRNYMAEEDVNNISQLARENQVNVFMERLFL